MFHRSHLLKAFRHRPRGTPRVQVLSDHCEIPLKQSIKFDQNIQLQMNDIMI